MRCVSSRAALAAALVLTAASTAWAQAPADSRPAAPAPASSTPPSVPPEPLTAKERLGAKWMDEQRVDNCKVPVDKRGAKPRPDACTNALAN